MDFKKEKWRLISSEQLVQPNIINFVLDHLCDSTKNPVHPTYAVIINDPMDPRFRNSARKEIKGLLDRGTYVVVKEKDVPPGATILRSRIINSIKTDPEGNEIFKTRLVIQGHLDPEKGMTVNEAPTILRSSTRIILSLASTMGFGLWSRDVKQAFIQSEENLHRELYVKPPKRPDLLGMIHQPEGLLHAVKTLYGLAESPGYWWQTFKRYHVMDLGMTQTILDPCLFFKKKESELTGITGTLVDDTLGAGSDEFAAEEEQKSSKYDVKSRDETLPIVFGGSTIMRTSNGYVLTQEEYSEKLVMLSPNNFTSEEFAHLRGQLAYVATSTRPDVSYVNAKLAQVVSTKAEPSDVRLVNAAVKTLQKHRRGLCFPKLDLSSLVVRGYADAGFSTNSDNSSQLGIVVTLCDKHDNASILHYASWKSRRVANSVLAAEVHALTSCYDYSYTIAHDLSNILSQKIPIEIFTDSKSIFDTITKLKSITEKRLLIYLSALREAYTSGEIRNMGHILTSYNVADPLTKKMNSTIMTQLLETGKLSHPVNQWIIHEPNQDETN